MQETLTALGVLAVLTILSLLNKGSEVLKYILFGLICSVVVFNTTYLIFSTILTNQQSVTKGPVHYHADFEIWSCGQKVDLVDPHGLENKVGTPIFHEHNDNRIHVEGSVIDYQEINLGGFFRTIGGEMNNESLTIPTNDGVVTLENGMMCKGVLGELQVFVYKTKGDSFYQEKLDNPDQYVLSPHSKVPPGDCIIIEFDRPKDQTDKLCNFYQVAKEKGEISER